MAIRPTLLAASLRVFARGLCFEVLLAHRHLFCLAAASLGAAAGCLASPFNSNRCGFELSVRPLHAIYGAGPNAPVFPVFAFCDLQESALPGKLQQPARDGGMLSFGHGISSRTPRPRLRPPRPRRSPWLFASDWH